MLSFLFSLSYSGAPRALHSFPTRRSSDLSRGARGVICLLPHVDTVWAYMEAVSASPTGRVMVERWLGGRSEEHTSELQSHSDLVCRLLLEKKKNEQRPRRDAEATKATRRR